MARTQRPGERASIRAISEAAADRQSEKANPFARMYARTTFSFDRIDSATFIDGVAHSLGEGHAITLSLTADGGALKVTLWAGGKKHIAYAADDETTNEIFEALGPPLKTTDAGKGE